MHVCFSVEKQSKVLEHYSYKHYWITGSGIRSKQENNYSPPPSPNMQYNT